LYYSGKKKRHTLKNVLFVDESGSIHFLSDTYEGRVHDKCIADEAGYTLPNASILYQDAGFQGFPLPGVQIMQPKKKPRNGTLTPQEKEENRRISSVRVRIEHVIGDIKRYRIIHDIIRFSCSEFRDMVMETCCGLHNFRIWLKRKSSPKIKTNLDEVSCCKRIGIDVRPKIRANGLLACRYPILWFAGTWIRTQVAPGNGFLSPFAGPGPTPAFWGHMPKQFINQIWAGS
jgi:transposase, IS4 family